MNDNSENGNDPSQCQTSGIPHKHLGRIRVIPQKPDRRSDKGRTEYHQFSGMRNVHDIQIIGIDHIPRHIGQDSQRRSDNRRRSGSQTIQTIGQIRPIRHSCNDKNSNQNKQQPPQLVGIFSRKRSKPGIIELVIFKKRNSCFRRFDIFCTDLLGTLGRKSFIHRTGHHTDFTHRSPLPDDDLIIHIEGQSDNQSEPYLSDHFETAFQPFLMLPEYFDIVIGETDQSQPYCRNNHQLDIDIIQTGEQKYRDQDSQ